MQTMRINGIDLNVHIEGEGPPVLLVHGFPDTHAVWRKQIPALVAAGYRVIAPDMRGYGASEMPPRVADYSLDRLSGDLLALLDALGIDTVRLVAHDWGAVIGWQFCMRHPERVDRYVALSVGHPNAYARGGLMQKLKGWYVLLFQLRGVAEWIFSAFDWFVFRNFVDFPEEFPHWRAALARPGRFTAGLNYYRANLRLLLKSDWPSVAVPVMGVWSDRDIALVERQMTESRHHVAATWRYERIDGASHWLQLDAPARVNELLLDFLRGP